MQPCSDTQPDCATTRTRWRSRAPSLAANSPPLTPVPDRPSSAPPAHPPHDSRGYALKRAATRVCCAAGARVTGRNSGTGLRRAAFHPCERNARADVATSRVKAEGWARTGQPKQRHRRGRARLPQPAARGKANNLRGAGDHLRTQIWIICTHRLSSLIAPCTLDHLRTQGFCHLAHLYTHTLLPQGGGVGGGIKHTRSSAPAQHCGGGGVVGGRGEW